MTSDKGWTKGPWSVPHFATVDPSKEGHQCKCGYVFAEGQQGMGAICDVYFSDGSEGESENEPMEKAISNARLIAAAPELYDALAELLRTEPMDDDHPELVAARIKARAALQRAEGYV